MIDFAKFIFHPVVALPTTYEVYDFTQSYDPSRMRSGEYGVGRYLEKRKGMYTSELFSGQRDIHMGIDLAAPAGTPVHAFYDGEIHLQAYNAAVGDYGYTIITRHELGSEALFALHGHLSRASVEARTIGERFNAGDVIAWIGEKHENGGWNPHLHFQLSVLQPKTCDMPGAVSSESLEEALRLYPDPRLVLGPLY